MTVLSDQLEQLRTDKHKAEVEHVRKERERDLEVEALSKEKAALSQLKSELEEKVQKQSAELTNARTEIAKLGTIYILHILHASRYLHMYVFCSNYNYTFMICNFRGCTFQCKKRDQPIGEERRSTKNHRKSPARIAKRSHFAG